MPFALRAPTPADAEAIVAVVCACDVADFGEPDYDAGALAAEWSEPEVDLGRDARVAVDPDGAIAGYALLLGRDVRAWVHPGRLGEGAGTALRHHAEARARERGIERVHQQIAGSNAAAHALLDAAGYIAVAQHRHMAMALEPGHARAPTRPPASASVPSRRARTIAWPTR